MGAFREKKEEMVVVGIKCPIQMPSLFYNNSEILLKFYFSISHHFESLFP